MKNTDEKYLNVIKNNTFYYFNDEFEETYETHIFRVKEAILYLKNAVETNGCRKEVFEEFLTAQESIKILSCLRLLCYAQARGQWCGFR